MKDEPAVGIEMDDHGDGKFSLSGSASFSNIGPLLFAGQKLFIGHDKITINLANACFASSAGLALLMEWSSCCRLKASAWY